MAAQRVGPRQPGIDRQHDGPEAHMPPPAGVVLEGNHRVLGQDGVEDEAQVEEVAVTFCNMSGKRVSPVWRLWVSPTAQDGGASQNAR